MPENRVTYGRDAAVFWGQHVTVDYCSCGAKVSRFGRFLVGLGTR
jgi:hypothetical protein